MDTVCSIQAHNREYGETEETSRANVEEALELIPPIEKAAYLEAMQVAPRLVETEANPLVFLRYENFNCWNTACRIVSYWEERKRVFGEKAFLPLALVGESALSEEAVRAIHAGFAFGLPNDSEGRSVLYYDISIIKDLPTKVRIQILFYATRVLSLNPQTQTDGFVILASSESLTFNRDFGIVIKLMRDSIPAQIHSSHVICKHDTVMEGYSVFMQLACWITNQKTYFHLCRTTTECVAKLAAAGFTKDRLPTFLGGSIDLWQCSSFFFKSKERNEIAQGGQQTVTDQQISMPACAVNIGAVSSSFLKDRFQTKDKAPEKRVKEDKSTTVNFSPLPATAIEDSKRQASLNAEEKKQKPRQPNGVGDYDVLLGRGVGTRNHPGNRRLQFLIETNIKRYENAVSRTHIKQIKKEILNSIHENGRFIEYDNDSQMWVEVSSDFALQKIGQTFRNFHKKRRLLSRSTDSTK